MEMGSVNLSWEQVTVVVGAIIWFIRLEGKQASDSDLMKSRMDVSLERILTLDRRVESLQGKHESLERRVVEEISAIRELLAEMRSDVKSILNQREDRS